MAVHMASVFDESAESPELHFCPIPAKAGIFNFQPVSGIRLSPG
ncbi:MAG: hypothetical protein V2I97_07165 [Desulfococcaceae bacterium]|nr:hypothetical protein [Desulfococcaceae bacterium]